MNTRWMRYDCPDVVRDCILIRADDPTSRLCAEDEWDVILVDWMRAALRDGDVDRFFRMHNIMNRCNAETTF